MRYSVVHYPKADLGLNGGSIPEAYFLGGSVRNDWHVRLLERDAIRSSHFHCVLKGCQGA